MMNEAKKMKAEGKKRRDRTQQLLQNCEKTGMVHNTYQSCRRCFKQFAPMMGFKSTANGE